MIERSDEALLALVCTGDRAAFDELVGHLAGPVWTLLRRLTVDEVSAEDALQETFLAIWRAAPDYRSEGSVRSWVFGLARRQAARTWRRRAGEPKHTVSLTDLAVDAGWGQDPESAASRSEDRATLLHALATLNEADQDLITRCDLEESPVVEVAAQLAIAPGTARVRLHRARLKLLAALGPPPSEVHDG